MFGEIHGRVAVRRGGRWFAVQKQLSLTDKVIAQSHDRLPGNAWDKNMRMPNTSRVIKNQR